MALVPPGTSNGGIKIETLENLYRSLARRSALPRIFCGDFNSPQEERSNGEVITWGQDVSREGKVRWRGDTGKRWDLAERKLILGLKQFDLHDVYRVLHGYRRQDYSWYGVREGRSGGRRFDHIFASASLSPTSCVYIHAFGKGLSDHSAIEATFAI